MDKEGIVGSKVIPDRIWQESKSREARGRWTITGYLGLPEHKT